MAGGQLVARSQLAARRATGVYPPRWAGKIENTYFIQLDGKPWGLVFNSLNGEGLMLNLREDGDTGKNVRYPLYYSKGHTENTVSEYLLTAYLKQEANPKTSTARYNGKPAAK